MTPHEIVIRFGRPFDVHTQWGAFLVDVREIRVPFADRESAEAAQREITVTVRPVHDAGGEDYRPVVPGEAIGPWPEIENGEQVTLWISGSRLRARCAPACSGITTWIATADPAA